MRVALQRRFNNSVTIERGPLVYALNIGEEWHPVKPYNRSAPTSDPRVAHDYELHPTTDWKYALALASDRPEDTIVFETRPVGTSPFSPDQAPMVARVHGRRVPQWTLEHGAAGPVPSSPVPSEAPEVELTLLPYGCTNLRVTEFPLLE